jgi:hypothetical protein
MKNFIRKSFVVAIMVMPILSHAGRDCGGGTISAIRENANNGQMSALVMNWSSVMPKKYIGSSEWYNNSVVVRDAKARTAAMAAYHAGGVVRLYTNGNDCVNVDEVVLCKDETTCSQMVNIP